MEYYVLGHSPISLSVYAGLDSSIAPSHKPVPMSQWDASISLGMFKSRFPQFIWAIVGVKK